VENTLDVKLVALEKEPGSRVFILADAKDARMVFAIFRWGRLSMEDFSYGSASSL
jgi:hypothetical protein